MGQASGSLFGPAFRRAFGLARGALSLLGLVVSLAVAIPSVRDAIFEPPSLADAVFAVDKPQQPTVAGAAAEQAAPAEENREQRALAELIAKRYRVAEEAISGIVSSAYRAGAEHRVDPLLILAVVAILIGLPVALLTAFAGFGLMFAAVEAVARRRLLAFLTALVITCLAVTAAIVLTLGVLRHWQALLAVVLAIGALAALVINLQELRRGR